MMEALVAWVLSVSMLAAMPASDDYKLNNYGFGAGGVGNATSNNYGMNAITGELGGKDMSSNSYRAKSGEINTQQANVPEAPTFSNPANNYSKLHFIVNQANTGNPSDTKFAIAISSDNFATTQYVQSDNTVGATLGTEDYQTYTAWGGATGQYVIGLNSSTTYRIKVKAISGRFTESGYSPSTAATTSPPSLTYDIDVAPTDSETNPPFTINFGNLLPGSVSSSPSRIWIDLETNAESGGNVYLSSANTGLESASVAHTIASQTTDLATTSEGVGAQGASAGQTSGGPLALSSPYSSGGDNVGITDTVVRQIFSTPGPIVAGRGSFIIKAKSANATPSSADYTDTLTVIASANY